MLLDILLLFLFIALLGGFTRYRGYWGPSPPGTAPTPAVGWDPLGVLLFLLLLLVLLSLLSPWPVHHWYYR